MQKKLAVSAVVIIATLSVGLFVGYDVLTRNHDAQPGVYVGVTYCGDSVAEGKLLVDKVKHYTNLLVLQSGSLQRDLKSVNELGDYAISAGLCFLPYFGTIIESTFSVWLETAKQKWGDRFLGVYYGDEAGGKMLDDNVKFKDTTTGNEITKTRFGDIVVQKPDGVVIHYQIDGVINLSEPSSDSGDPSTVYGTFYPNGTRTGQFSNQSCYNTYGDLLIVKPFKDKDDAAFRFVNRDKEKIYYLKNQSVKIFTSDYGLYWWDYLSGYDILLAHIGWNIPANQQIALVRGAARLQHKDWGICITWKYNTPPYLDTGSEILSQMQIAYKCGAKYFVVFNYYENSSDPYGTMKEEHFQALKTFWNDLTKSPSDLHGSIKADLAVVLPQNYGWGMRQSQDKIWGIFEADELTKELWNVVQTSLTNNSLTTDIVYEDKEYSCEGEYAETSYWEQK